MLLHLIPGIGDLSPTVRALLAGATGWLICMALGGPFIRLLRRLKVQECTEKTPIEHEGMRRRIRSKSGTPTMGGLLLLTGLTTATLLWANLGDTYLLTALACALALGTVGAVDDQMKLRGKRREDRGFKPRHKLILQGVIGGLAGLAIAGKLGDAATRGLPFACLPFLRGLRWTVLPAFAAWGAFAGWRRLRRRGSPWSVQGRPRPALRS